MDDRLQELLKPVMEYMNTEYDKHTILVISPDYADLYRAECGISNKQHFED